MAGIGECALCDLPGPIPIELVRPMLEPGPPADREAMDKALRAAAEVMVEALPTGEDREVIEAAAKKMIGMEGDSAVEKVLAAGADEDGSDEE